ncbi:GGDEF domain-containing response regulator [Megalodesulfovibrio paquesii]
MSVAQDHFLSATAAPGCLLPNSRRGLAITADPVLAALLPTLWPADVLAWQLFSHVAQAMEELYAEPPHLLLVDAHLPDGSGLELAATVKSENVYRQMPVVVALPEAEAPELLAAQLAGGPEWECAEVDDFLLRPFAPLELRARLNLAMARARRTLDANPLSKLPGNTSIIQKIQELVDAKAEFGLAYVDLDNFKSFNDRYGFSRGDEALMMTARLLATVVQEQQCAASSMSFLGHIGGDDFVFILPATRVEAACQAVCNRFDAIVPSFYDEEDRQRRAIRSTDRQGRALEFPFMTVSIAVVMNYGAKLHHAGEVASMAASLKKLAKSKSGSSYVIDQRRA